MTTIAETKQSLEEIRDWLLELVELVHEHHPDLWASQLQVFPSDKPDDPWHWLKFRLEALDQTIADQALAELVSQLPYLAKQVFCLYYGLLSTKDVDIGNCTSIGAMFNMSHQQVPVLLARAKRQILLPGNDKLVRQAFVGSREWLLKELGL